MRGIVKGRVGLLWGNPKKRFLELMNEGLSQNPTKEQEGVDSQYPRFTR
jgi:hypothetical protein